MTRTEIGVLMVVVVLIIAWALLGPGGWVSGTIGAVIGVVVAAGLILNRRRDRH
jgi:Flp pilus assembly protein TadB